jgi:hypothetical protein
MFEKDCINRREVLVATGVIGVTGLVMANTAKAQGGGLTAEQKKRFSSIEKTESYFEKENGILRKKTLYKPTESKDSTSGWTQVACSARGWNHLPIAASLGTDVDVYVSAISWTTPHDTITTLGPPGSGTGILFGISGVAGLWLTAINEKEPQRYFGFTQGGTLATVVGDSYSEDNEGGYVLNFRKRA